MSLDPSSPRPIPEIVAPAGTPAKLETALHFGADAVYLGLKKYSLRAFAGNFSLDQLEWALDYAHARGRRVYVTVNVQPFDDDLEGIEATLRDLSRLKPDAVVLGDAGVVSLARQVAPKLTLHVSTQMGVTNARAARFWSEAGCARVVVARELSLQRLSTLCAGAGVPIEAFAHGAVCVGFSGRCLLSLYWAGEKRDPRRGSCAQGCRWAYRDLDREGAQAGERPPGEDQPLEHLRYRHLEDQRRPGEANLVEEDDHGTYFFDAKDLSALPVLDRLINTGVSALKLEGRTRSPHYLGVTVDVYRAARDQILAGDREGFRADVARYTTELLRAAVLRPFSTHFLTGEENDPHTYLPQGVPWDGRATYVGKVVGNDSDGVSIELSNALSTGTDIEIRSPGMRTETVEDAQVLSLNGQIVARAAVRTTIRLEGSFEAQAGALVRLSAGPRPLN
jgi:U32 family peptidase